MPGPETRLPSIETFPSSYGSNPATMLSIEVLPQPLGPTMAINSPSSTENETSDTARTSRFSRSSQYRFVRCSICNFTMRIFCGAESGSRLSIRRFRLSILLGFDARPERLLEKSFLHQTVDDAVIDDFVRIEILQLSRRFRVRLIHDRFHRRGHDVRNAFKLVRLREHVIDAF